MLVAGDLNVDSHSAEYASMLQDAGLVGADTRTGHPYSFDTRENSIARDRYPTTRARTSTTSCTGRGTPVRGVEQRRDPGAVRAVDGHQRGTSYTYTNLSDHYPVTGSAG